MLKHIFFTRSELACFRVARRNLSGKLELEVFDREFILTIVLINADLDLFTREELILSYCDQCGRLIIAYASETTSCMFFLLLEVDLRVGLLVIMIDPTSAPASKLGNVNKLAWEARVNHLVCDFFGGELSTNSILNEELLFGGHLELVRLG
jgi:hypothetical protein